MSNGQQTKAAIVMWNGDAEELKQVVDALAPWFGGESAVVQEDEPDGEPDAGEDADADQEPDEEPEQEPAGRNRVTDAEVAEWVRRAEKGESITEIARDAGRPMSTVFGRVKKARAKK